VLLLICKNFATKNFALFNDNTKIKPAVLEQQFKNRYFCGGISTDR